MTSRVISTAAAPPAASVPSEVATSFSAALAFLKRRLPPPSAIPGLVSTETRINWLEHLDLPREIRNNIYSQTLPSETRMHDNVLDPNLRLLFVNQHTQDECFELLNDWKKNRALHLQYSSITSLIAGLDALADNSLAPFQQPTISTTGTYNGHRDLSIPSDRPRHSCNICPTLMLSDTECRFEIKFACPARYMQSFYKDELRYGCKTIFSKVNRLARPHLAGIELRCIQKNTRSLAMMRGESGEVESLLPTYKREVSRTLYRSGKNIADLLHHGNSGNRAFGFRNPRALIWCSLMWTYLICRSRASGWIRSVPMRA
jgi:hypothetical protein